MWYPKGMVKSNTLISALALLAISTAASASFAQEPPAPAAAAPATAAAAPSAQPGSGPAAAPAAPATGARVHDGFYLRLSGGYGLVSVSQSSSPAAPAAEAKISGMGPAFDLSIGGSPIRGLAVAGTIVAHVVSTPTVEAGGVKKDGDKGIFMTYFGPTVDGYPDPTGGFHVGGGVGYGTVSSVNYDAAGLAFQAFTGYDFWLGDSWSVGPLGRFLFVNGKKDAGGGTTINDPGMSIVLGISVVDH